MSRIKFDDIGMYLNFTVILDEELVDEKEESELDCSRKIEKLEDIVKFIELFRKQDYKTLFKGHLDEYEIDMIEVVEMGGIVHEGKNKDGKYIRLHSCCGGKHNGYIW